MKNLGLVFLAAGIFSVANAQDVPQVEVPSLVLNAFQSKYSNATDVEWEKQGDLYKVEFEIGNRDHDLWVDKNGNIKKHKEEVTKTELPEAVVKKLKTDFRDYRVDDVDRIETNGKVYFQIDLDSFTGDREVLFLADGSIQQGIE